MTYHLAPSTAPRTQNLLGGVFGFGLAFGFGFGFDFRQLAKQIGVKLVIDLGDSRVKLGVEVGDCPIKLGINFGDVVLQVSDVLLLDRGQRPAYRIGKPSNGGKHQNNLNSNWHNKNSSLGAFQLPPVYHNQIKKQAQKTQTIPLVRLREAT